STGAAADLVAELGPAEWVRSTGSVPVASFTVTKLRWLAENEPAAAAHTAAVALPHDWLTWRLAGGERARGASASEPRTVRGGWDVSALTTDRSDASGTGYWSPSENSYRPDLLRTAFGRVPVLPTVLGPCAAAGLTPGGASLGPGAG